MPRRLRSHTRNTGTLLFLLWTGIFLHPLLSYGGTQTKVQQPPLLRAEALAKNLVGTFVHKHFRQAAKQVRRIRRQFHEMHKRMAQRPFNERKEREVAMMHAWLRVISVAIRNRSDIGGAIAANQLTAALIRNQNFPDTVKSSIAWLDYLGREIVLLNMEDPKANADLLDIRRDDITTTWNHLRDLLLRDFRNKSVTMEVDHLVQHINTHPDPADQIADGKRMHAWVEKLERLPDPLQSGRQDSLSGKSNSSAST